MKIEAINLFLSIMFAILSFSIMVTLIYNNEISNLEQISRSFYNSNSMYFTISKTKVDYQSLYNKLPADTILYSQLPSSSDIRSVIFKNKINYPQIIKGRFFCEKDFSSSNSKLAVVGSKVGTTKLNGRQYINFNGESYEVIGIIGYSMPTKLDKTVMLSMNYNLLTLNSRYVISGNDQQKNYNFLGNENLFGEVAVQDKKPTSILHIINTGMNQIVTSILFILVIVFNAFILSYFWLARKNDEITVKKMNGYKNRQILIDLYKEFFSICAIGLAFGTLVTIIFSLNRYTVNISTFALSYIIIFLISGVYFGIIARTKLMEVNSRKLGVNN